MNPQVCYVYDCSTFQLESIYPVKLCKEPIEFDVNFIQRWDSATQQDVLHISCTSSAPGIWNFKTDRFECSVRGLDAEGVSGECSPFSMLLAAFIGKTLVTDARDDLLWVASYGTDTVLLLALWEETSERFAADINTLARCIPPNMTYTFHDIWLEENEQAQEQQSNLNAVLRQFQAWLPEDHRLLARLISGSLRTLTVKVAMNALWFIRFPISAFCRNGLGVFAAYDEMEWIVTEKDPVRVWYERSELRLGLRDPYELITHSVIILNTYPRMRRDTRCVAGTRLVVEMLSYFQDVNFVQGNASLRWYLNPTIGVVEQMLRDLTVRYVFADFEADTGVWQEGVPNSLETDYTAGRAEDSVPNYYHREPEPRAYTNIRLMRIVHCSSAFNPALDLGNHQPTDSSTIVRRLLNGGAQRVEGGIGEQHYLDYLQTLIQFMCSTETLQLILRLKCMVQGGDYDQLVYRVNSFLATCKFPPIQT